MVTWRRGLQCLLPGQEPAPQSHRPTADPMRILFLNSARNWGGNEKWVALAAQALAREHHVHAAYRRPVVGERLATLPGVTTVRWPFRAGVDAWTLANLVRYIRREQIDCLIPTKGKDYALAGMAARLTGVSNVLRLGIVRRLHPWSHQRWIYGRWVDGLIVNAPSIRDAALASGLLTPEQVAVIPNGVDVDAVTAAAQERGAPPFPFTVATVGKLTERKDLATLLRGFALFAGQVPEAGLVIIGEGGERGRLEALAQALGIPTRVRFRGYQANPYPDLATAHAFVSTSRNEGFPNTVIEALYLGVPVIATAAGGTWEWLTPDADGIAIPFAEPAAINQALSALYNDTARRQALATQGEATARERFDLQLMGKRLSEFLGAVNTQRRCVDRPYTAD